MSYYVSTFFNKKQWENYGSNWLRQAKIGMLNPIVFGYQLTDVAYEKAKELGFEMINLPDIYPQTKRSYYDSLLQVLKDGDKVQITNPNKNPSYAINFEEANCDLSCGVFDVDIRAATNYIINLKTKAEVMKQLDEVKKTYGGLLNSDCFCTNTDFLRVYLGMLNGYYDSERLSDFNEDVVFSLFIFTNKYKVLVLGES